MSTYILKLPNRTATLKITEEPSRFAVDLTLSQYGEFGDEEDLVKWLLEILLPYEADARPFEFKNPHSHEVATVFDGFVFIKRPLQP